MATSGTYTDHPNNLALIGNALRKINRLGDHETFADTDNRYVAALATLKLIMKHFSAAHGMPMWAIHEATLACSLFTDADGVTIGLSGCDVTQVAPLRIISAFRRDSIDATNPVDVPMQVYTANDYNTIPNKSSTGIPLFYTYYPEGPAESTNAARGTLKLWPVPDDYSVTNSSVVIRYIRSLQDVGTSTQDVEVPQEWHRALVYTLAYDLAQDYGIDINLRDRIKVDRDQIVAEATGSSTEEGSFFVQPRYKR